MPRLVFLTERFPPDLGGVSSSAGRIVQVLSQLGLDVDVLVWSRQLQPGEILRPQPDQIPVYRIGLYRQWDMSLPITLNLLDELQDQHSYVAIWGHYLFPAGYVAVWFAQLRNLRSTVSARGNDIDRGLFPPGDFARLQWTLQTADQVTCVSQDLAHKIRILSHREDVLILRNAVDGQRFSPGESRLNRSDLGIFPEELVLGFSGELREKKGQAVLLNALHGIRTLRPACLLVIGEIRESQHAALQIFAAHYPQDAARVIVTGHLPNPEPVVQHLRICDLYLQPSLWEGMPNALLEAMATQQCCLGSDAGGIPEIIDHGRTGFILPRSRLHHLDIAIQECLQLDPASRQKIGRAARHHVLTSFSPEQEKRGIQKVVDLLLG